MGNTTKNNSLTDDMVEKIVADRLEKFRKELFQELSNFKLSVLDAIERGLAIEREIQESPYFSAEKNLEKELRTSAKLIGAIIEKWKGVGCISVLQKYKNSGSIKDERSLNRS